MSKSHLLVSTFYLIKNVNQDLEVYNLFNNIRIIERIDNLIFVTLPFILILTLLQYKLKLFVLFF